VTDADRGTDATVFGAFHRQRRRESLRRRGPIAAVLTLAIAAGAWGVVTHPPAASPASASTQNPVAQNPVAQNPGAASGQDAALAGQPAAQQGGAAASQNTALAAGPSNPTTASDSPSADPTLPTDPALPADPATDPSSLPQTGTPAATQQHFSIAVATRGYQAELDQCQWVRMDVGAVAPIVGAHNFCHGDMVLAMQPGDLVAITGTDLDGDYQVTGSRDAHAGDNAATATSGLTADLILQTCYWGDNGLRLVTLRQVDLSLPPVVVDHY
jgi:hypothetical protein